VIIQGSIGKLLVPTRYGTNRTVGLPPAQAKVTFSKNSASQDRSSSMYKLRQYQQDAVNSTIRYFQKKRDPAVIVLPTGAGKSLVIAELARIARGRVLVLAHVKELVEQNHQKYRAYGLEAGIYSAGLNKKDAFQKVIFGSIQSVAKASASFFENFSLLVIDECHRVSLDGDTQYATVADKVREKNPHLCILGLTATPYRLGVGWIFNYSHSGTLRTAEERFFKRCIFELPLKTMIAERYLTLPVKIDIPVTSYDFSSLGVAGTSYSTTEIEAILKKQRRITPLIVQNIVDITETYKRQGAMIFCSSIKHAEEVLAHLPVGSGRLVVGDTSSYERDSIIDDFKNKKFKYLVNVSVLTTGFDAPHVDVIAILRPTESVSLYQQIVGRGLRLSGGKSDCFVLDYTGMNYNIFSPEIGESKPRPESVPVEIECPGCGHINHFWGLVDDDGLVIEHFGRKCRGAAHDRETLDITPCGYRFRFKICDQCGCQNDLSARECCHCSHQLVDADAKLKQAKLSKNAHVLIPDSVEMIERIDKNNSPFLEVRYYDFNAKFLSEFHFLSNQTSLKKFNINFLRSHMKRPEMNMAIRSVQDVVDLKSSLRMPAFIIGRKQGKFWRITEKIFAEEL
jgi:DNA repair protein RadD